MDELWKQAFDSSEKGEKVSHRFAALLFAEAAAQPAPVQEPVAQLGDGVLWCDTCRSVQETIHHTSPNDRDVWCKGEAAWLQGPFYTTPPAAEWQKIECPICGDMAVATDIPAPQPAPVQECLVCNGMGFIDGVGAKCRRCDGRGLTLATTPPAAPVPLTEPQRKAIYDAAQGLDVMKAILLTEAAYGIKET
jgi:hypothetical protein